ncbi:hypothetical protein BKA62DRAFT_631712 [Auriculariales sp. MPI-PUGE-AT-0066]|nr:hypothetical protein BKA62DRAFT_631712 [Auriculariales sp. MPI-PUGE-AT-0066]
MRPDDEKDAAASAQPPQPGVAVPVRPRKGWLVVRRTFEETPGDASYMSMMRTFLDARSKDPKRARPKDTFFVVLKGTVLYLYEDEAMGDCWAALDVSLHRVTIFPENQPDGELFAKRNAICLKPTAPAPPASVTKEMSSHNEPEEVKQEDPPAKKKEANVLDAATAKRDEARDEAFDPSTPWFIFVRGNTDMEDWYLALLQCARPPHNAAALPPNVEPVFATEDMAGLINLLDATEDRIPMRWLNALIGRMFFSYYRTATLEQEIIRRIHKKISKVKRPAFLKEILVTDVNVGNTAPMLQKPMLKELTREGDMSFEVGLRYKGEIRITIETTAIINLGARFKNYNVKLVLAVVLRELEGNVLVKIKRPPSNRIWYAFTTAPRMDLGVEPVVSDRAIKWSMILNGIESKIKETIQESVVLPNFDDIAFFDSRKMDQRGGIWDDALRNALQTKAEPEPNPVDMLPPAAGKEPPSDTSVSPPLRPKSASTETVDTVPLPPTVLPHRGGSAPPSVLPHRGESAPPTILTTSPPDAPTPVNNAWLDANFNTSTSTIMKTAGSSDDDTHSARGRTLADLGPDEHSQRSSSIPPDDDEYEDHSVLHPMARRQHRQSVSSMSSMSGISDSGEDRESVGSRPSRPTTPSSSGGTGTSPRPQSTFLTNLRARAQAAENGPLATSAKEAMKKWSSSWAARKDSAGSAKMDIQTPAHYDGNSDRETPSAGPSGSNGLTRTNTNASATSTGTVFGSLRGRFDEMRDAVAARREQQIREREALAGGAQKNPDSLVGYSSEGLELERKESHGSTSGVGSVSAVRINASSTTPGPVSGTTTGFTPVVPTSTASTSVSAVNVAPSVAPVSPSPAPAAPAVQVPSTPASPIMKQPAASRMMIPTIHASHRGEPMAFGSAPSPPSVPGETPRTRVMSTATSSVYKLFTGTRSSLSAQGSRSTDEEGHVLTPAEAEQSLAESTPVSPTPPPLPPRKSPVQQTPSQVFPEYLPRVTSQPFEEDVAETPRAETPSNGQFVSSSLPMSASPASDALRSVVAQDHRRRVSLTHSRQSSGSSSGYNKRHSSASVEPPQLTTQSENESAFAPPPETSQDYTAIDPNSNEILDTSEMLEHAPEGGRHPPPLPPRGYNVPLSQEVQ